MIDTAVLAIAGSDLMFRLVSVLILGGTATMCAILVINNVTAPKANMAFTSHVMSMDTTSGDPSAAWRAVKSPRLHWLAFGAIVVGEAVCAVLGYIGVVRLLTELGDAGPAWDSAKAFGYAAYLVALLVWFVFFQVVGTAWFLSWQSERWNGIRDSTRINLMTIAGLILLHLS